MSGFVPDCCGFVTVRFVRMDPEPRAEYHCAGCGSTWRERRRWRNFWQGRPNAAAHAGHDGRRLLRRLGWVS